MGYERDGRDDDRGQDGWRQPRQDYDRSAGTGRYDPRAQGYGASASRRDDGGRQAGREDYTRTTGVRRDRDDYDRQRQSRDDNDRGFLDRAGDEVRSWFGDEDAERRRRLDERDAERDERRPAYDRPATSGYGARDETDPRHAATDTHYRAWRDRQMEQFDRDYSEYRREHQSKFDTEFHGWRTNRQGQRDSLTRVREHQEVVGADGKHVGTVDKVRGETIVLTKQDTDAGGRHHAIPLSWVQSVADKVTISKTADDAHAHWRDAERNSAFWNDDKQDGGNPAGTTARPASAMPGTTPESGNR